MLTPEQIAALRDWAGHIADPINDFLLEDIARRIAKAGQLTSSAAYQVWRAQELSMSQREIKKKLKQLLNVSNKELEKLLTQSAEVGYNFDIKRFPQVKGVSFVKNESLQEIVRSAVALAKESLQNITQTLGMVDPYGKPLPLQDAYRSCMDYAFKQVITGATDQNTAIRRATKNLADKGVRVIDYESGVHTSLEAATRRNIMGGLGLMQEQITAATYEEMGCNGWELSAHANSAPDHEPFQGRQYSDADYKALNNSLVRRISTLNCGHVAFPIILGVNEPQYTEEQLQKFQEDNAKGITYNGRHYTGYEATQMQRKLERTIRKQKSRALVYEAAGDTDKLTVTQIKLQRARQEYRKFSRAAGLRTETERAHVAGFGRRQAAAERATVEKYSKVRYHGDGTVVVTDDWTQRAHPRLPMRYAPNAVVLTLSQSGKQKDRTFYDKNGLQIRQIHGGAHGNRKRHPFGENGEHAHDVVWKDGKIVERPVREFSDFERKENADIL